MDTFTVSKHARAPIVERVAGWSVRHRNVAGNPDNDDQAVVPALNAVAAAAATHPGLTIAEAGDASLGRATSATVSQDFRKAEVTSLPVSLVLLLIVFGALIAAGIPLLL